MPRSLDRVGDILKTDSGRKTDSREKPGAGGTELKRKVITEFISY